VKHVPIGHIVGADLRALDLHGVDEGIDHCSLGGKLPEDLADLRELRNTVCRCDAMSDADQELQLYLQPDHCLLILVDVWRGRMKLLLAHLDAAIYEHTVPRHFHVIEEGTESFSSYLLASGLSKIVREAAS